MLDKYLQTCNNNIVIKKSKEQKMDTITQLQASEIMDIIAEHVTLGIADLREYYRDIHALNLHTIDEQEELELITQIVNRLTREAFPDICYVMGIDNIEDDPQ